VETAAVNLNDFKSTLKDKEPPTGVSPLLKALWWEAKGDWEKAHTIAQDIGSSEAAWVHAYLHRKEGDEWNAGYWYSRAGKAKFKGSFEEEWEGIVSELLS